MQGKTRLWFTLVLGCWFTTSAARGGETYDLRPHLTKGDLANVEVLVEVAGELKVSEQGKSTQLPMQIKATAQYEEGVVSGTSTPAGARRFTRKYDAVSAKFQVDGRRMEPALAKDHEYLISDWSGEKFQTYLPIGNLTREELDLVSLPADSAVVDMLLPDKPVAVGDRWQYMPEVLAAVVGLDAVDKSDVESELKEVQGTLAKCELNGTLNGGIGGVGSECQLKAKFTFDLTSKRVTWVAMLVKEKRSIGHAAPGVEATSRLQLKITPVVQPKLLTANLETMNVDPTPANTALKFRSPSEDFEFNYDRRWQVMNQDEKGTSFRFVDQGDLIAQLNVVPLKKSGPGGPIQLSTFQEDIQKALGENFGQFVSAATNADDPSRLVYRVICTGTANELPVQWNYHMVAAPSGEQALLIFTLESELVERFGDQDRQLVESVRLANPPQTAGRPTTRR